MNDAAKVDRDAPFAINPQDKPRQDGAVHPPTRYRTSLTAASP